MGLPGVSGTGPTRTDMHCHNCGKGFIAELDFSISGNHVVQCPRCGHEHYRVIKNGEVTGDRYSSQAGETIRVEQSCVWKSDDLLKQTSVASLYIRNRWLNFGREDGAI